MSQTIAHTHTRLFHSVCLAANIIMVLTALVNSSTQNKLSGSVGASSGEFHSKVCVCASAYARVSVHVRVRTLALNYNPLFQPPHSQLDLSSAVKISAEANSKRPSGANVTFVFSLFLPPTTTASTATLRALRTACLSLRCGVYLRGNVSYL